MRRLLRIDASARQEGSHSRRLADHFESRWLEVTPEGIVIRRDLAREPTPHLDNPTIRAFQAGTEAREAADARGVALSDSLIAELLAADDVLVASPLYNFNVPSPLKAYVDHVVREGRTFACGKGGYRGLVQGKSVYLITTQGGEPSAPGAAVSRLDEAAPSARRGVRARSAGRRSRHPDRAPRLGRRASRRWWRQGRRHAQDPPRR